MLLRRRTPTFPPLDRVSLDERWAMGESRPGEPVWFLRVNLALDVLAGHPEFGHIVYVGVGFRDVDANGLPDAPELEDVAVIEDELVLELCAARASLPAVVSTRDGSRKFVFYSRDAEGAVARVHAVSDRHAEQPMEVGIVPDARWKMYRGYFQALVDAHRRAR